MVQPTVVTSNAPDFMLGWKQGRQVLVPTARISSITASCVLNRNQVEFPIRADSASAIVVTVPTDRELDLAGDAAVSAVLYQAGLGAVSFTAGSGVTLRGTPPTAAQYTTVGIMRVGANEWAYL